MYEETVKDYALKNFLTLSKCYQNCLNIPRALITYNFNCERELLKGKKELQSEIDTWLKRVSDKSKKISHDGLIKRLVDLQAKILIKINCLNYHETALLLFHLQNGTILK